MIDSITPYHMMEKHHYEGKKRITYERVILKNNRIFLKCPGLLSRKAARAIVTLLNDLEPCR